MDLGLGMSFSEARDLLRQYRESKERRSEDVFALSMITACKEFQTINNESVIIMEQILMAALDCHDYNQSFMYALMLAGTFPNSHRVILSNAACLEAEGKYTKALTLIDNLIAADETNAPARKRRVAILKAQGLISEAIKELVDYLKKFMSDVEAWQELCDLYLQVLEYPRAAFCAEEVILHQPHNHLIHQRLADIRYTMGGVENMELAKTYYSHSLKLNPNNMRALLGLFLVTTNLLNHYKSSGNSSKRKEVWKLSQWTQTQAAGKPKGNGLVQAMLSLAVTE